MSAVRKVATALEMTEILPSRLPAQEEDAVYSLFSLRRKVMKAWMLTTVQTPKWSFDLAPTLEKTMSQHPPLILMEIEDESLVGGRKRNKTFALRSGNLGRERPDVHAEHNRGSCGDV